MVKREDFKREMIAAFSKMAVTYDEYAAIPRLAAEKLTASLEPWIDMVPDGPILEIGCGTGLVTEKILTLFPGRTFIISDISSNMVEICKDRLKRKGLLHDKISFKVLDAEELKKKDEFALIVSGFTIQWFQDAMFVGYNLIDALKHTGLLIMSFPGSRSFYQWKSACDELQIPYTANTLPEWDRLGVQYSMKPVLIDTFDEIYPERYDSALDFFKTLKKTGAYVQKKKDKRLSFRQFRKLLNHMDSKSESVIEIGYHLVYMAIRKNESG